MILSARDLTIGYSDRVVGRGLDLALETGAAVALLGPNGCGKTTLMRTLLGLLAPRDGEGAHRQPPPPRLHLARACAADRLCTANSRGCSGKSDPANIVTFCSRSSPTAGPQTIDLIRLIGLLSLMCIPAGAEPHGGPVRSRKAEITFGGSASGKRVNFS